MGDTWFYMQATWRNVKKAVRAMAGAGDCRLRDIEAMADLCPRVVLVRNRLMCAALSFVLLIKICTSIFHVGP